MTDEPPWNDPDLIERMRVMWFDGITVASMGVMLGLTKGQIVGKVRRLGWQGRPSPLREKSRQPVVTVVEGSVMPTHQPASKSCAMPLWPNDARPGHSKYGVFCTAAAQLGSPYCREHHGRCYQTTVAAKRVFDGKRWVKIDDLAAKVPA